mgnify:CR=1 FL=1
MPGQKRPDLVAPICGASFRRAPGDGVAEVKRVMSAAQPGVHLVLVNRRPPER